MYIVRWLLSHPMIATWVALGVVAILLVSGSGNKEEALTSDISTTSFSDVLKTDVSSTEEKVSANTAISKEETTKVVDTSEVKKIADSEPAKSTATTDLSQATSEEMLLMAREAYWNNGLDEAAQIYNKLIEKQPELYEYKGELGNVYWRQGYPKTAAELYPEIAIPMIESGSAERVANMIGFIGLFYPDRAADIHKKMQSKK